MNAGDIFRWGFMIMFGSIGLASFWTTITMVKNGIQERNSGYYGWGFLAFMFFLFASTFFLVLVFDPPMVY